MTLPEHTTIIPAFSETVFTPLKFMPQDPSDPAVHSLRCALLMKALDSHFFGGRMFIFQNGFFHTHDHWRDETTGRPIFFLQYTPEAYGYKTKEEALLGVQALISQWGFGDFMVLYNGSPWRAAEIEDNEYEAHFNMAMRQGIATKFGEAAAAKSVRQRCSPCKGTKQPLVFLDDTALFNRLVQEGAEIWGQSRHRVAKLKMKLPEGEEIDFDLFVDRESLLTDLTRHFFGNRAFTKARPFMMYIRDDADRKTRSYSLMVQVSPETLGYQSVEEAHSGLRKLAMELGHVQDALKIDIVQTTHWTLNDIASLEEDPGQGPIVFRPGRG